MEEKQFGISSDGLHVLAMIFMLMDHMWASFLMDQPWLTCLGRIAFPIFAFMISEGYFHTHNFKKYLARMAGFALLSEIPFDLLYGGVAYYPYHQNVLWTFVIALLGIRAMECFRSKGKKWIRIPGIIGVILLTCLASIAARTDFNAAGILMVYIFYFFRGNKWWNYLGQLLCMYWINVEVMGGLCYIVTIFGQNVELVQQGFALLALIPIWMYRGRKGNFGKAFRWFCYGFYPLHCLILGLMQIT